MTLSAMLLTALLTLHSADVSTSCYAFARGFHEMNPFVPTSCVAAAGETAAIDTGLLWFVQRRVHTPWKRALVYGAVAGAAVQPVLHNIHQLKGERQ